MQTARRPDGGLEWSPRALNALSWLRTPEQSLVVGARESTLSKAIPNASPNYLFLGGGMMSGAQVTRMALTHASTHSVQSSLNTHSVQSGGGGEGPAVEEQGGGGRGCHQG